MGFQGSQNHVETAKSIIDQLLDAQRQLATACVSHNDIKPTNILIDDDSNGKVKVFTNVVNPKKIPLNNINR